MLYKAFYELDFEEIKANCREENIASKKILGKFGFKFIEKIHGENIDNNTGEFIDFDCSSLGKREYCFY